jgi:1-acyl-sn-glycerol-3-phosphate acyltransferase
MKVKMFLGRTLLKMLGWEFKGQRPDGFDKAVMIAAPHTSNFDFLLAIGVFWGLGYPFKVLIKKFWLKFPFGLITKPLGGVAVDRSSNSVGNVITQSVDLIKNANEKMYLLITPEGTRSRVRKWKTGFYRIAERANVPIVLCYVDYDNKIAAVTKVFHPTGDFKADMAEIEAFYVKYGRAKYKENFNPKIY